MWSMYGMIHTCTYHVDYKTIFCRFLTYDPCMSWGMYHAIHGSHVSGTDRRLSSSQHDKYRYVSYHSWITCQEPTEDCLIVNMINTGMYHAIHGSHVSGTDRRLSSSQHDKYRYVSCHSWITCQEPTEDCLLVNIGSWHVIHEWHDTYLYLSCWL
jgi:hypothetical protein